MSKGAINFSSDNEYYTPKQIVKMFSDGFEYDPATTPGKAEDLGIPNYDTIETDGLKADWTRFKSIWCNPPFTIKHEFTFQKPCFWECDYQARQGLELRADRYIRDKLAK